MFPTARSVRGMPVAALLALALLGAGCGGGDRRDAPTARHEEASGSGSREARSTAASMNAWASGRAAHAQSRAQAALPPTPTALPAGALPVPLFRQATPYSCGAAVALAILTYWGVEDCGEAALYEKVGTTEKDGTEPKRITAAMREYGLAAELRQGLSVEDLRAALARGDTAILDLQAWREAAEKPWVDEWEDGHYVVLVAIDAHFLYVMDPSVSGGYAFLPIEEFVDRWHDYEDRTGTVVRYVHAAIFVRGETPLRTFPAPLMRME